MKRLVGLLAAIISLALVCPVLAQTGPGGSGGGGQAAERHNMRSAALGSFMLIRLYNPKTVITVKSGVSSLGTMPPNSHQPGSMRSAVLKLEKEEITAILGPDWYLGEKKITLKTGDQVEVTGSKVTLAGKPTILAHDLKVDGKSIILRTNRGFPVWLKGQPGNRPGK